MKDTYSENGIIANQDSSGKSESLSITYEGILVKSGADDVYAHYGYGSKWTNKGFVRMSKTHEGFTVNIPLGKTGPINIVFKDSADNWDNNNGSNYSFSIRSK